MDKRTYAQQRVLSSRELTEGETPSRRLRRAEAELIASLARQVALDDRQFHSWPTVTLLSDYDQLFLKDLWTLRAEVTA